MSRFFLFSLSILTALSSCQRSSCRDEVVCETVHRYGMPLDFQDWSARGQSGQVISMRKDGTKITRSYDRGVLDGESTYSFPHRDAIERRDFYSQGTLRHRLFCYLNGLPRKETVFEEPDVESITTWYENGAPQAKERMEGGLLIQGEYYDRDLLVESRVQNGSGIKTQRDGCGELISCDTVKDGKIMQSTTFHPNGVPSATTPYLDGLIEGERRTYHSGGEPATVEAWSGNLQHGLTIEYEHGEKRGEVIYLNGKKEGVERRFRDDGQTVAQEITWVRGLRHGPCCTYMGVDKKVDWYFRGCFVPNRATFDMMSHY